MFGGIAPAGDELPAVLRWEEQHCHDRLVILSDVWLDRPETLDKLHAILSGEVPCLVH